jgi:hypothetical protein
MTGVITTADRIFLCLGGLEPQPQGELRKSQIAVANIYLSKEGLCMPVIPALQRLRQEVHLGY